VRITLRQLHPVGGTGREHAVIEVTTRVVDHASANQSPGETPAFTEIAYAPVGSGPNLSLRSARSNHAEIGVKTKLAEGQRRPHAVRQRGQDAPVRT
jgi:hypothetical protein